MKMSDNKTESNETRLYKCYPDDPDPFENILSDMPINLPTKVLTFDDFTENMPYTFRVYQN